MTSRLTDWPADIIDLKLDLLSHEHSVEYILERTNGKRIPDPAGEEADVEKASQLATKLDGLALALLQAARAIEKRHLSFEDYLKDWESKRAELLDDPDFDPTITKYPRTVAWTWKTSYDQLTDAEKYLFDVLCWFAPDPIPERIVTQPWPQEILESLPGEIRDEIETNHRRLLIHLYDLSLTEAPLDATRQFSMHGIMQEVGRTWQRKSKTNVDRMRSSVAVLRKDFIRTGTENLTLNILPDLLQTLPHVLQILVAANVEICSRMDRCDFRRTLADIYDDQGKNRLALHEIEIAVEAGRDEHAIDPSDESVQLSYGRALSQSIDLFNRVGDQTSAWRQAETAMPLARDWESRTDDGMLDVRSQIFNYTGSVRSNKGDHDEALKLFDASLKIREDLCKREPDNLAHQRDLGIALENVGRIWENKGEQEEALKLFEANHKIREDSCQREPDNLAHQRDLGTAINSVGRIRENKGEQEEALKLFEASRQIREDSCLREPDNLAHQRNLGIALENVGRVRENKGEQDEALKLFDASRKIREDLCQREPDHLAHQRELGIALFYCGRVSRKVQGENAAVSYLERSATIFRALKQSASFGDTETNIQVVEAELRLARGE